MVYFIANISIEDEKIYENYIRNSDEVFEKYNGKYLAVDDKPMILEGKWIYSRNVIIEFQTEEEFNSWYYSKDYQNILKFRLEGAKCDTILVHGKF